MLARVGLLGICLLTARWARFKQSAHQLVGKFMYLNARRFETEHPTIEVIGMCSEEEMHCRESWTAVERISCYPNPNPRGHTRA